MASPPVQVLRNFINGDYCAPVGGQYLDSYCPARGKVEWHSPASTKEDVEAAVRAAQAAFPKWSATPVAQRAALLNRIGDILEKRLEEFAQAESRDQGKTVNTARTVDIPRSIKNFRFFASAVLHHDESAWPHDEGGEFLNYTQRSPIGVVGLISPWNLPLYLLTWKIAPALVSGNCAVCKPSELSPLTAYMLGDVLKEAGLPPGVCSAC